MKKLFIFFLAMCSVTAYADEKSERVSNLNLTSIKIVGSTCKLLDEPMFMRNKTLLAEAVVKVMVNATPLEFRLQSSDSRSDFHEPVLYNSFCKTLAESANEAARNMALTLRRIKSGDVDQEIVDDKVFCKREAMFVTYDESQVITSYNIRNYSVVCPQ